MEMAPRLALAPVTGAMIFLAVRLLMADRSLELARRDLAAGRTSDGMEHYHAARGRGLAADLWYSPRSRRQPRSRRWRPRCVRLTARMLKTPGTRSHTFMRAPVRLRIPKRVWRAAIRCSPNWFKPHWMLAQILRREGRLEEARAEAERAAYLNAGKNPEVRRPVPPAGKSFVKTAQWASVRLSWFAKIADGRVWPRSC